MRALGPLALLVCSVLAAGTARARVTLDELGALEREVVSDALAARRLTVDPAPDGKVIGRVEAVTAEVFSRHDWLFQRFNVFHRTTRERSLLREALFHPGDRYNEAIVEETARNLNDPNYSSVVVIVPIASPRPGVVDLLIVTRDVCSLRL